MARARRVATGKTSAKASSSGEATLTCPECGKTFTRPASLGAHRNRAHGVVGASARRTGRGGSSRRSRTTRRGAAQMTQPSNSRGRASSPNATDAGALNRDRLLQVLFPNGLPAREEVIRRANAWLDEAEGLARAK
jgi:uncharacterized C2H2 Zn-finger protein